MEMQTTLQRQDMYREARDIFDKPGLTPCQLQEINQELRRQFDQLGDTADRLNTNNKELQQENKELRAKLETKCLNLDAAEGYIEQLKEQRDELLKQQESFKKFMVDLSSKNLSKDEIAILTGIEVAYNKYFTKQD